MRAQRAVWKTEQEAPSRWRRRPAMRQDRKGKNALIDVSRIYSTPGKLSADIEELTDSVSHEQDAGQNFNVPAQSRGKRQREEDHLVKEAHQPFRRGQEASLNGYSSPQTASERACQAPGYLEIYI